MNAYEHGVAAILKELGQSEIMCCGHKEYRLPKNYKSDPSFDMVAFRAAVGAILDGTTPPVALIPAHDDWNRATLRRGARGVDVVALQTKLQLQADGLFGAITEAAVRQLQRSKGVVPDGIVGPVTWALLDA